MNKIQVENSNNIEPFTHNHLYSDAPIQFVECILSEISRIRMNKFWALARKQKTKNREKNCLLRMPT